MANDDFDLPRPTDAVPSATSAVINDDAKVLDYVINGTGTVTTRTGKQIMTIDQAIQGAAPVPLNGGVWASGQIFEFYNQYMYYDGLAYAALPATTLPYTVGATPDLGFVYQIKLNDHSQLANIDGVGGHDDISKRRFGSAVDMGLYTGHSVGKMYSTGSTDWKVVNTSGYPLLGGLFAIPMNGIYLSDLGLSSDNTASENVTAMSSAISLSSSLSVATLKAAAGNYLFDDGFELTSSGVTIKGDYSKTNFFFSHAGDVACFDAKANHLKFKSLFIDVNHTTPPSNGGVGNIIQIGAYSTLTPELYSDIEMSDLQLTKSGLYKTNTTVIGIYNRCNNIKGKNIVIDGGSSGVICHWSGDFDINFPDSSPATITWHPFAIDFDNLTVRNGLLPVSISGCYDVTFRKVVAENCLNGLYVLPGDFGTTIADSVQRERVGDNVVCSEFAITNPSSIAVQVVGNGGRNVFTMLKTARTTLRNFSVTGGASSAANPILIDKASNVLIDNLKVKGYANYDSVTFLQSRDCKIINSDLSSKRGVISAGAIGLEVLSTDIKGAGTDSSVGAKVSRAGNTTVTLSSPIGLGDTSIDVNATTLVIYGEQDIVFPDGTAVQVFAERYFPLGSTNILIDSSKTVQISGEVGTANANSKRVTFRGGKSTKNFYGIEVEGGSESVTIDDINFVQNRRNDIYIHGDLNKEIKILANDYSQSNTNTGGNRANIQADFVDGLTITGGSFNEADSIVNARFGVNVGSNVSNANISINTVYGVEAGGVFVFHNAQSVEAAARGRNFIGLNRLNAGITEVSGGGYDTVTIAAVP